MRVNLVTDQLTANFSLSEFVCTADSNKMRLTPKFFMFVNALQEFRNWYNRVIVINSGYRTRKYNMSLPNASPVSRHMEGLAVDISFPTNEYLSPKRKREFLKNVMIQWFIICDKYDQKGGVGFYDWGFHLDMGTRKTRSHWDYRTLH